MGKDDEKGCKLFVFHRRVINDEGKWIIGKNISQGCFPLQRGYSGVLRAWHPKLTNWALILFQSHPYGIAMLRKLNFQAKTWLIRNVVCFEMYWQPGKVQWVWEADRRARHRQRLCLRHLQPQKGEDSFGCLASTSFSIAVRRPKRRSERWTEPQ